MKTLCFLMMLAAVPAFAETAKEPAPSATASKPDGVAIAPAQDAAKSHADKLTPYDFSPKYDFSPNRRPIPSQPKPGAEKPLGVG